MTRRVTQKIVEHKSVWFGFVCFIDLTAYQPLMDYLMPEHDTNNLHAVIWFQVFLSNENNFQIYLFDSLVGL